MIRKKSFKLQGKQSPQPKRQASPNGIDKNNEKNKNQEAFCIDNGGARLFFSINLIIFFIVMISLAYHRIAGFCSKIRSNFALVLYYSNNLHPVLRSLCTG
jgi:hypothetical protein